jgi:N6-L-threonylcarbamoyladenine synthase
MRILSIETSCDESAIAIVDTAPQPDGGLLFRVEADQMASQALLHAQYGGVFPMLAKREHAKALVPLLVAALREAGLHQITSRHVIESPLRPEFADMMEREPELYAQFISVIPHLSAPPIDKIAVTMGPGLEPALWVGLNFAKALSLVWKIPIVPINHMEGHLLVPLLQPVSAGTHFLPPPPLPLVSLLVSGGHTEWVSTTSYGSYVRLGGTLDDAAGEAFDKVARMIGLPYPGGPEVSRVGASGDPRRFEFPRPMIHTPDLSCSFSGLKTAVRYTVEKLGPLTPSDVADVARCFEDAVVDVLTTKTLRAIESTNAQSVTVGGGVSANATLRTRMHERIEVALGVPVHFPTPKLSTDNALMIAVACGAVPRRPEASYSLLKAFGHWKVSDPNPWLS